MDNCSVNNCYLKPLHFITPILTNYFLSYKYLTVIILGAILTLAFAPFDYLIALPLALSGLLFYLQLIPSVRGQFLLGMCFGIGFFTSNLYWITASLFTDIKHFWWMVPFALFGLPTLLSLFIGTLCVLTSYFKNNKILMALAFSAFWAIIEHIRSYTFLPFPCSILGYCTNASIYLMQALSIVGVHGMSLILCIIATSFFTRNKIYIACNILLLLAIYGFGYYRIATTELKPIPTEYTLRLIQPNLVEHHMGDRQKQNHALRRLMEMSVADLNINLKYIIIWPEAAFPFGFQQGSLWNRILSNTIPPESYLITGLDRVEVSNDHYYPHNSIMIFANNKGGIDYYDKVLLVPFGEYIPLRNFMPQIIDKVAYGIGDFIPGKKGKLLQINKIISFLPLICYEALFPYFIGSIKLDKIDFFLNITNDAWFGNTVGPYQHASMSKARAVEFAKPLVRVANNGVSFIVDPLGNTIKKTALNHTLTLDSQLQLYNMRPTFYYKYQYLNLILIIALLFYCFIAKKILSKK